MLRARVAFGALVGLFLCAPAPVGAAPRDPVSPDPKSLAVPPEELSKARELVQKLGSEAFPDREAAEHELVTMGRAARAALLDGLYLDPDPEIRARCRALLPKANAEELKARLDTFLADTEGKFEHDLPGWHQLRATVRGEWKMFGWTYNTRPKADKAARELFIEFMQAPGGLQVLNAMNRPPEELGQLVATRKQELYGARVVRPGVAARTVPPLAEVAVLLFGESQVPARHVPRALNITAVITSCGLTGAVQGTDERALALRAVLTAWFDSRTDALDLYTAFNLASQMNNNGDTVARLATRLLTTPNVPGSYKGQALTTFVRLKMTDQIPVLEKAFTDSSVLVTMVQIVDGKRVQRSIEVRDAALAAALVMTGQEPTEYGFEPFPRPVGGTFSYAWAKIPDDKRKEAHEKWAKWREKNP